MQGDQPPKPIRVQPVDVLYTIFDFGSAASMFWLRSIMINGHILEISQRISVTRV